MWVVWPTVPRIHEWMILSGALLCKYKYQEKMTPPLPPIKTTKNSISDFDWFLSLSCLCLEV